jgi:hypothetical protein
MLRVAVDAMLPEPARAINEQSKPPNPAGLLQTSRALAAVALYNLGRKQEAAAYFRRVGDYASYAKRGGAGSAYLTITGIWTPRAVDQIAQTCLREIGEPTNSRPISPADRQRGPPRTPPSGPRGRL